MMYIELGKLPGTDSKVTLACYEESVQLWIGRGEYSPQRSGALAVLCHVAAAITSPLDLRYWIERGSALGARIDDEHVHLYYEIDGLTSSIAYVPRSDIGSAATFIETARERAEQLMEWKAAPKPSPQSYPLVVPPGDTIDLVH